AYVFGTGPGTVLPSRLHAFLKTRRELAVPDIQFLFRGAPAGAHLWFPGITPAYEDSFGLRPVVLPPESRGVVRLRSAAPSAPVRIVQNFLPTEHDVRTTREGVKLGRDIAGRKGLDPFRGRETAPGPDCRTDAEIDAFVRRTAITAHHPCATCAMGTGEDAALDPTLRVRGVEGLRVVDASAMPDLVSGNINACVLMIAEKAADLVLGLPAPARLPDGSADSEGVGAEGLRGPVRRAAGQAPQQPPVQSGLSESPDPQHRGPAHVRLSRVLRGHMARHRLPAGASRRRADTPRRDGQQPGRGPDHHDRRD